MVNPRRPVLSSCFASRAGAALLAMAGAVLLGAVPALARENLGMYESWGAFRDPLVPRCYAIAKAVPSRLERDYEPYATVAIWPRRNVRNQVHFRLSRELAPGAEIVLRIGGERFVLAGGGGDAWSADRTMNAAIVSAMRSASRMTVTSRDRRGRRFSNSWPLAGAGSAMDAAALGCARMR